jgi:hypothetical protein
MMMPQILIPLLSAFIPLNALSAAAAAERPFFFYHLLCSLLIRSIKLKLPELESKLSP